MKYFFLLFTFLFSFSDNSKKSEFNVDDIISSHIYEVGEDFNIKKVQSYYCERETTINGFKVSESIYLILDSIILLKSSFLEKETLLCYDFKELNTWGKHSDSSEIIELDKRSRNYLRTQALIFGPLVDYLEKGLEITYLGIEKLGRKISTFKFNLEYPNQKGYSETVYLNTNTCLIEKINSPIGETYFSNYKKIENIQMPTKIEIITDSGNVTYHLNFISLNSGIDRSIFEKPIQ